MHETDLKRVQEALSIGAAIAEKELRGSAVLIPLLPGENGLEVLFEVRASDMKFQPGEVCFPGGRLNEGENPQDAAVRETCEELLVRPQQVVITGALPRSAGPKGGHVWPFVGTIEDYNGSHGTYEVDRVFTVPLTWFFEHEPVEYEVEMVQRPPADFPHDLVSSDPEHDWKNWHHSVPVYVDSDPVIWGMTARVMRTFVRLLRKGGFQL